MPIRARESVSFEINTGNTVEPAIKANAAIKNVPLSTPKVKLRLKFGSEFDIAHKIFKCSAFCKKVEVINVSLEYRQGINYIVFLADVSSQLEGLVCV